MVFDSLEALPTQFGDKKKTPARKGHYRTLI